MSSEEKKSNGGGTAKEPETNEEAGCVSSPVAGSPERWATSLDSWSWKNGGTITGKTAGSTDKGVIAVKRVLPFRVSIEGNISSGKSTLVRALGALPTASIPGHLHIRPVMESILPELLEAFLKDPMRHALTLQLNTMSRRRLGYDARIHEFPGDKNLILFDRWMEGDAAFMTKNALSGFIGKTGGKTYISATNLTTVGDLTRNLMDGIVYLHSTPESCHRNVQKRGDIDAGYAPLYLVEVDLVHFYLIMATVMNSNTDRHIPPVFYVDWRNFGKTEDFLQSIYENIIAKSRHQRAVIRWANNLELGVFCRQQHRRRAACKGGQCTVDMSMNSEKKLETKEDTLPIWVDDKSIPGVCLLSYDDSEVLEKKWVKNSEFLPCLGGHYRWVHTQAWRNQLVQASQMGQPIVLVPSTDRVHVTMLDFFLGFPKTLLDSVSVEPNLTRRDHSSSHHFLFIGLLCSLVILFIAMFLTMRR